MTQSEGQKESQEADRSPDHRHRCEREHHLGDIERKSQPLPLASDVDPHLTLSVGGWRALVEGTPRTLWPALLVGNGRSQDGLAIGRRCCRLGEDRFGGLGKPHRGHPSEDEHNERQPEHPGCPELKEAHSHRRGHKAGESGKNGKLCIRTREIVLGLGHGRHQCRLGDQVQLGEHEDAERLGEQEQPSDVGGHQEDQDRASNRCDRHGRAPRVATPVEQRA